MRLVEHGPHDVLVDGEKLQPVCAAGFDLAHALTSLFGRLGAGKDLVKINARGDDLAQIALLP